MPNRPPRLHPFCAHLLLLALVALWTDACWGQGAALPQTVGEAVFRSQWVGPQADRVIDESAFATDGVQPVTDWASKLHKGLYIGSLRIVTGLGAGWEYSNRSYGNSTTNQSATSSPYFAPSLGLDYTRDFGPLALSLGYGGGLVYYLNPDYTSAQSGNQRNPFNQTFRLRLSQTGKRHQASLRATAALGQGQDIQAGANTTTLNAQLAGDWSYLLNEFVSLGLYAAGDTQITRYGDDNNSGGDAFNLRLGSAADWLYSGKTTLGVRGNLTYSQQSILTASVTAPPPPPAPVVDPAATNTAVIVPLPPPTYTTNTTTYTTSRQAAELLLTAKHSLTSKLLVTSGLGAGYVTSSGITNSAYNGFRPVYNLDIEYTPSEKTRVRAYGGLEGTAIVPDYGLQLTWTPRETTSVSVSIYQDQQFSVTTIDQYQVSRGAVATLQQRFFSTVTFSLSGGWEQTENVALSEDQQNGETTKYSFASIGIRWDLNSWMYWQASVWTSTGNAMTGSSAGQDDSPQTIGSIGLNLIF